jgi:nucleoside-diphosphate-sugar epimerase
MTTVVVTGAAGATGRRVRAILAADPAVTAVVAVDRRAVPSTGTVTARRLDLRSATRSDWEEILAGADALVHLAFDGDTERAGRRTAGANVGGTRRMLEAATTAGVPQVVLLSSAMVYGAWPNNPQPITESAPLRPNPDFAYAVQRAQVEQLLADWVTAGHGRCAAVLRPATILSSSGWIGRAMAAATGIRAGQDDPPQQFVHPDDAAAAVVAAWRHRLDGPYNVAPDGWVDGEGLRRLAANPARVRLPRRLASTVSRVRWRFQRGPIPPGLLPYTEHSWVVANDRLETDGHWRPTYSNEAAYVSGTEAVWWTELSPKRKQELALTLAGVVGVVLAASAAVLVRWLTRRAGSAR